MSEATRLSRVEQLTDRLLDDVVSGRYPPGTALPPERELAKRLGANRTSLRQALARLAQMGVVVARQGSGTVVLNVEDTTDPDLIARLLSRQDASLLVELLEVRQAVGALVGRLAASRATTADLDALKADLHRARTSTSPADLQRHELAYFATLVTATQNRALRTMLRWIEQSYGRMTDPFLAAFDDHDGVVAGLESITDAVRAHDADRAEKAMDLYARTSAERMVEALQGSVVGSTVHEGDLVISDPDLG